MTQTGRATRAGNVAFAVTGALAVVALAVVVLSAAAAWDTRNDPEGMVGFMAVLFGGPALLYVIGFGLTAFVLARTGRVTHRRLALAAGWAAVLVTVLTVWMTTQL